MRQAGQLGVGAPRIEAAQQQAHVVRAEQRSPELQHRPLAAAEGVGVAVRQDDAHSARAQRLRLDRCRSLE